MNVNLTPQIFFVIDDHGANSERTTAISHLDLAILSLSYSCCLGISAEHGHIAYTFIKN